MTFFAKHKTIPRFSYIKILSHETAIAANRYSCLVAVLALYQQEKRVHIHAQIADIQRSKCEPSFLISVTVTPNVLYMCVLGVTLVFSLLL